MSNYVLSIDQGTTGTRVCVVDQKGQIVAGAYSEFKQYYPKAGWVEHDPEEIWQTVLSGIKLCLEDQSIRLAQIVGVGITNQRETTVVWDKKTGRPIGRAIVWQCRRTQEICDKLKAKEGVERIVKRKTGLVIDPYFSGTKIRWILDQDSGLRKRAKSGEIAFGTIDSYLVWKLSGGKDHIIEVSNASRTLLLDIKKGQWDDDLLKIFKVPKEMLPRVCPSSGPLSQVFGVPGLHNGTPISGIAGDQQAALFGQTAFKTGDAKVTYGTGSFLLMNSGKTPLRSKSGLLSTIAWQLGDDQNLTYALEGGAFICGAAVQWLRDELKIIESSSEVEALASSVETTEGVQFLPAFVGLGAPHWNPRVRGMITGLTRGSGRAHIARACLEAMALQNVDILLAMKKDLGKPLRKIRVDGGASANSLLMQIQADLLGMAIERPVSVESTVLGAAYLAGLGTGFWKSQSEISELWKRDQEFRAQMKKKERDSHLKRWSHLVKLSQRLLV